MQNLNVKFQKQIIMLKSQNELIGMKIVLKIVSDRNLHGMYYFRLKDKTM